VLAGLVVPSGLILLEGGPLTVQTALALCAGVSAFSLMAINLFLATRPVLIEAALGGLDRVYLTHKWTGIAALAAAVLHQSLDMTFEGDIVTVDLAKLAVDAAETAFPLLVALVLVSWIKRLPPRVTAPLASIPLLARWSHRDLLPYALWRWSHRALGILFLVFCYHQFFVIVPFKANAQVSAYLNVMAALGVVSFLYTQFGAPLRPRRYEVTRVEHLPAATVIEAKPLGRPLKPRPGAFAVISVARAGLREPHPFTISGTLPDGGLQFSIRALGDYTTRLRDTVAVGDRMTIEGGYGRFDHRRGGAQQIWLAGGIGITPFLSFVDALEPSDQRQIHLVYCVTSAEQVVGLDRLEAAAARVPGFTFEIHASRTAGRFDAARLIEAAPFPLREASFHFCGPAPMRDGMIKGLRDAGQSPKSLHFEEFEFR
jgi:predicted ferric reductase